MNNSLKMTGFVTLDLFDEFGNLKDRREVPNAVVTIGKNFIASRITGVSFGVMTHMAVGTSNTGPSDLARTALAAEVAASRTALTVSGGTATNAVIAFSASFAAGVGTGALVEAGIFNGTSTYPTTYMLCRTTFSVINKGASDSLTINWNVTVN